MLISSHFFHGFVSLKIHNGIGAFWTHPPKQSFFLSCSIVCFLGQFAKSKSKSESESKYSEQKRPNIFLQTMAVTSGESRLRSSFGRAWLIHFESIKNVSASTHVTRVQYRSHSRKMTLQKTCHRSKKLNTQFKEGMHMNKD